MLLFILVYAAIVCPLRSFAASIPPNLLPLTSFWNHTSDLTPNSSDIAAPSRRLGTNPTPDPHAHYFEDDRIWIIWHTYGASLGPNPSHIGNILTQVTVDVMHHPTKASMNGQTRRYREEGEGVSMELQFQARSGVTWILWLNIAIDVLEYLPRDEEGGMRECGFFVRPVNEQTVLGRGSLRLLSGLREAEDM